MASYTLAYLAEFLDAQLHGNGDDEVFGIASINKAQSNDISFIVNKQYEAMLATTKAGALIVKELYGDLEHVNQIVVPDPYLAYAKISRLFCDLPKQSIGIHPSASVSENATIANDVAIGPNCTIEDDVVIGEGTRLIANVFVGKGSTIGGQCVLFPNTTVYHDTQIGNSVRIHAATVIGSDGFGYAPVSGQWLKIYQLGRVIIGNEVEIGSSCSIDRGALDDTVIGDNVIIDNQVHIAHNVVIGKGTAIAGCCGIAGSTHIGSGCTIAGMVGIAGHFEIADNVHILGGSVVRQGIDKAGTYSSGTLLAEAKQWRRNAIYLSQIGKWVSQLKGLIKK